jgi:hypothetical protein
MWFVFFFFSIGVGEGQDIRGTVNDCVEENDGFGEHQWPGTDDGLSVFLSGTSIEGDGV